MKHAYGSTCEISILKVKKNSLVLNSTACYISMKTVMANIRIRNAVQMSLYKLCVRNTYFFVRVLTAVKRY